MLDNVSMVILLRIIIIVVISSSQGTKMIRNGYVLPVLILGATLIGIVSKGLISRPIGVIGGRFR